MKQQAGFIQLIMSLLLIVLVLFPKDKLLAQGRSAYDLAAWIIAAVDDNDTTTINWALKQGGQIDFKRGDINALQLAIYKGKADMVKFLLAKGASVDSVDANGKTALAYAEKMERPDIIQLIRRHMNLGSPTAVVITDTIKSSAGGLPTTTTGALQKELLYRVGDTVLHSRDRGKTWEPGIIKEVSTNARLLADGISPYLVENMAKTAQGYRDTNFITTLSRKPGWTTFYIGDWDLYLGLAVTERLIDRDVYQVISGGTRLPPLRINSDGSYSWVLDKKKIIKGKWQANKNQPGIILLNGERGADWLMYNTTDTNNKKIYKTDYIILAPINQYYGNKHGFRIQPKK
jgi:hypothetical protein